MGINGIFGLAVKRKLYKVMDIKEAAEKFRREYGEDPEIAVDGSSAVWHLYDSSDYYRGGQYKKFHEDCKNFVQQFHDVGIRLVFFFHGVPTKDEMLMWSEKKKERVMNISNLFSNLRPEPLPSDRWKTLPEAVIPSARVIFKDLGCKVYLSKGNCKLDVAKYVSHSNHCLAVFTNDSNFFALKGVCSVLTFRNLKRDGELKTYQFSSADIAYNLGIPQEYMPTYATFVGNDFVRADLLSVAYGNLKKRYPDKTSIQDFVAEMMKQEDPTDLVNMCKIAFAGKWRDALTMVEAGIRSYRFEPTSWDELIMYVEDKHTAGEIPGTLLSVMKCQLFRIGDVLEDLSEARKEDCPATGLVLRPMRARMYKVLLWESDSAMCCVTEHLFTETGKVRTEEVEQEKRLPAGMKHPGLQQLWSSDDSQRRWSFFTWMVAPYIKSYVLQELDPQFLVVPAAALLFLKHEAGILHRHEVIAFCATAATVAATSECDWASKAALPLDARAIYLASLFMRCVLHVLDAAATCGLTFPREIDCLPDAYFDGKVFHDIYVTTRNVNSEKPRFTGEAQNEVIFHQLLRVIDHSDNGLSPRQNNTNVMLTKS